MSAIAAARPHFRRQLILLASCWALVTTSMLLLVSVTALVGNTLADDKSLVALPIALQFAATACATVPASFLMNRIGRRNGFLVAASLMITGASTAVVAIYILSFWLYCLACILIGSAAGFAWYYRFAAAEVVPDSYKSRAISLVLAGGIAAAVFGPTLARYSKDLFAPVFFAGSFVSIIALQLVVVLVLAFVRTPRPAAVDLKSGRPLAEIARQPKFLIAVLGGVVAYSVMVLLMSVTPLAMQMCGLSFSDATHVIQWHVLGMYVPAFFTGHLIKWFGTLPVMTAGVVANVACVVIAAAGQEFNNFWVALCLLGVGWNFLYTGATTLLTETYTPAERAKTQALNEFLIFIVVGAATFTSGKVLTANGATGWTTVNLAVLPLILAVLGLIGWLSFRHRQVKPA
jgi:predicted MFS family arabinose efflux permease